jgi:predicted amidohydrolase
MKVAALQMVSTPDVVRNLEAARRLIAQAAAQGAQLVALPEYFCLLGRHDTDKLHIAEAPLCEVGERPAAGSGHPRAPIQQALADAAREHRLWLIGGTLPLRTADPQRVRNSSCVFAPDGSLAARYDKMHLFRFDSGREQFDETRVLQPGARPALFELPSRDGHTWRVGMSVCYDLRFPELYRHYAAQGADILLVPSAFTHTTGQAHWELLLRARAVENLAWVVAPAQGGLHENGRRTWGHSMAVDPWGLIQAQCPQGEAVLLAELDAERVAQCRAQLPALAHRRL